MTRPPKILRLVNRRDLIITRFGTQMMCMSLVASIVYVPYHVDILAWDPISIVMAAIQVIATAMDVTADGHDAKMVPVPSAFMTGAQIPGSRSLRCVYVCANSLHRCIRVWCILRNHRYPNNT